MKKETSIAIFLGIIAGIGIAIFVILNSRGVTQDSGETILGDVSPTLAITTEDIDPLTISSPEDESVVDTNSIRIEGSTQAGALVIIQTPLQEDVIQSENGDFSSEVELVSGENEIKVTAYSEKNIDTRTLTIYSTSTQ